MRTCLKHGLSTAALMLAAALSFPQQTQAQACAADSFEAVKYIVCEPEKGKTQVRLFWKNAGSEPYRSFSAVAKAVSDEGRTLAFAMNAGMYRADFSPLGLYVEDGRELRPVNREAGDGSGGPVPNFYKKPNGVFYLDDKGAGIVPTDEYLERRPEARFATQSGPMLVIRNRLHPAFIVGSTDRTRRSGVGICGDGAVRFAISEDPVNFYDFARLFRDHLHCPDALFLDGGMGTGVYNPAMGRNDISWHGGFGPIVGFVE